MTELDPNGVSHEMDFWRRFVTEPTFQAWIADAPTPDLDERVGVALRVLNPRLVLDVGSGPVSILRGTIPNVVTADPLSDLYQQILDYAGLGIVPPVAHAAEDLCCEIGKGGKVLRQGFRPGSMPVVHCSNALDHCKDPQAALAAMVKLVEPGGLLIIQGHANEATWEKHSGFHQWDLALGGEGQLWVSGAAYTTAVHPESLGCELVYYSQQLNIRQREWFVWIVRKL